MAKSLKELEIELEDLTKNIKIYKESYEKYESVVTYLKNNSKTTETDRIIGEFKAFCNNEGISASEFEASKYDTYKQRIEDRLKTMEKRKEIVNNYLDIEKRMHDLELTEDKRNSLKKEAAKHYDEGTKEYNDYLQKLVNQYKKDSQKTKDQLINSKELVQEEEKKLKKENGVGQVIRSMIPGGSGLYNLYAKVHNANARFQRDHKVLNAIVKIGLSAAVTIIGFSAVSAMGLIGIMNVPAIAGVLGIATGINSIRHIFVKKAREKHLQLKNEKAKKKNSFKDAIFKFIYNTFYTCFSLK